MNEKTSARFELIAQCTAYLLCAPKTIENSNDRKQVELIRDAVLEIITEYNYKRLCRNLIDLAAKLGDIRYSYSQQFWFKYLSIFGVAMPE